MSESTDCVYFADADYAGPGRRYLSFLIDLLFLLIVWWVIYTLAAAVLVPVEVWKMPPSLERQAIMREHLASVGPGMSLGWLLFCFAYHVVLRRTSFGTLGYLVTRMRMVDETGNPPPWKRLIKRFFLAIPFDLPLGASYLACRKHHRRQAVHDQIAGTWLVRASAEPAGLARIAYQTKLLGTYLLTYIDVEPYDPEAEAERQAASEAETVESDVASSSA